MLKNGCKFIEVIYISVEPVKVTTYNGKEIEYPDFIPHKLSVDTGYVNSILGLKLTKEQVSGHIQQMSLETAPNDDPNKITVVVPPTRPDILHACDVAEDVGIAYGFNNLPWKFPKTSTVAAPLPINKLTDQVRREVALAGWTEVLPLILVFSITYN